jgi:hypothetical protein
VIVRAGTSFGAEALGIIVSASGSALALPHAPRTSGARRLSERWERHAHSLHLHKVFHCVGAVGVEHWETRCAIHELAASLPTSASISSSAPATAGAAAGLGCPTALSRVLGILVVWVVEVLVPTLSVQRAWGRGRHEVKIIGFLTRRRSWATGYGCGRGRRRRRGLGLCGRQSVPRDVELVLDSLKDVVEKRFWIFGQKVRNLLLAELAHDGNVGIVLEQGNNILGENVGVGVRPSGNETCWSANVKYVPRDPTRSWSASASGWGGQRVDKRVLDALHNPCLEQRRVLLGKQHGFVKLHLELKGFRSGHKINKDVAVGGKARFWSTPIRLLDTS